MSIAAVARPWRGTYIEVSIESGGDVHINDDFSARISIDCSTMPWLASPGGHVERRMLDRTGAELARATSLVRYAAESRFPAHEHGGGEEFLVLDGVFSDEHGDCPAGAYVRNPVGTRHTPSSRPGCTIFVKLWWMHAADREVVRLDTTEAARWMPVAPGVSAMPLHRFRAAETMLFRLDAGAALAARTLPGGEEVLVLSGACQDADGRYNRLAWTRRPIGDASRLSSPTGCTLFVKRGHLADPPPAPV